MIVSELTKNFSPKLPYRKEKFVTIKSPSILMNEQKQGAKFQNFRAYSEQVIYNGDLV